MADGRMLKKKITGSRRLAALANDTARMFYMLLLAHLDVEGRFSADPDILKGAIAPRLKHITPKMIESIVNDMAENEVIKLYSFDGDRYLEYRNFKDNQNLRVDREKASEIPSPVKGCAITPGVLPDNSRIPPAQVKLSKDKIREDIAQKRFAQFWSIYPKKKSKDKALKAFKSIDPDEELLQAMITSIVQAKKSEDWAKDKGKWIPFPATWLNGRRWEDEIEVQQIKQAPVYEDWTGRGKDNPEGQKRVANLVHNTFKRIT